MKVINIFLNKVFKKSTIPVVLVYFGPKESVSQFMPKLASYYNSMYDIIPCNNWDDLERSLLLKPKALIIHYSEILNKKDNCAESIINIDLFVKLKDKHPKVRIAISIDQHTPRNLIKEVFGSKFIKNLVPSSIDFGSIEYITALTAIMHQTYYCPKKIIDLLPTDVVHIKHARTISATLLTPRQNEIAALISKNQLSNKQIARVLGISESAVKFHLKKIFKKHNVTSRLQLSNELLKQK